MIKEQTKQYNLRHLLSKKNDPKRLSIINELISRLCNAQYISTDEFEKCDTHRIVQFKDTENEETQYFSVSYRYISKDKLNALLTTNSSIDLSGCYLDELTLPENITSITAKLLFIQGNTNLQRMHISGDFIFNASYFNGSARFVNIRLINNGFFKSAHFNGTVRFRNIRCKCSLDFSGTSFSQSEFKNCLIENDIVFKNSQFFSDIAILYSRIGERTSFNNSLFLSRANFVSVDFGKYAQFTGSSFAGETEFYMTASQSKYQFEFARFNSSVTFKEVELFNGLYLHGAEGNTVIFKDTFFRSDSDLCFQRVSRLSFECCSFHSNLSIRLNRADPPSALFFYRNDNYGNIFLDWQNDQVDKALKMGMCEIYDSGIHHGIRSKIELDQLVFLERNYRILSQPTNEDFAMIFRKRTETKNMSFISRGIRSIIDYVSNYGTSPEKCLYFIMLCIFTFGLLYYFISRFNPSSFNTQLYFFDCICYSGACFLTANYGEFVATGSFCRVLTVLEGFLGVFNTAYFVTILARKILR